MLRIKGVTKDDASEEAQGFCPLPAVKEVAAEAASKFHE
jgi:hypothetical protein